MGSLHNGGDVDGKAAGTRYSYGMEGTMATRNFDLELTLNGSLILIDAMSERASAWLEQFAGPDSTWFGESLVVEHRFIADFARVAADAGFALGRRREALI
jgi:hypothetical protein